MTEEHNINNLMLMGKKDHDSLHWQLRKERIGG